MTIAEEMALLYAEIEKPLAKGNPIGLMDDLDYRSQWLARSAEILGECQFVYDRARGEAASEATAQGLSGNVAKDFITGQCATENRLLLLAERLNSTLVHQIDAVRTLLSYEKQYMNGGHFGEAVRR